jgi:hypothetical protein
VKNVNTLGEKKKMIHTLCYVTIVGGIKGKSYTIKKTFISFGKRKLKKTK